MIILKTQTPKIPMVKRKVNKFLEHKYVSISAAYQQILNLDNNENATISKQIEELLAGDKTWMSADQIEQLMVPLLHGDILDATIKNNIFEAEALGTNVEKYYKSRLVSSETDNAKQVLLKQLFQHLQSYAIKLRLKQRYINNAWHLASYVFIATFILFFLPYFFPPLLDYLYHIGEGKGRAIDIFTAVTSGAMGAAFSMLTGLRRGINKSSLNGLHLLQQKSYVISKIITGFGAGLIFFYFLQSGLLSGVAFPEFSNDTDATGKLILDVKSIALIVIWCFLSGFSEKLVPTILSKTEGQLKTELPNTDISE